MPTKCTPRPSPACGDLSFFPVSLITVSLVMGLRYPVENIPPVQVLCEFLFLAVGCMMLCLIGMTNDLIGVGYRYKFLV